MELKQESANSMETRQRHHLVKRLKRASQHAEALYKLCQEQTVDIRTVLDVKVRVAVHVFGGGSMLLTMWGK